MYTCLPYVPELDVRPFDDSGIHRFEYHGRTVSLLRNKGSTITVGWSREPLTLEDITLSVWGTSNALLLTLVTECLEAAVEREASGITVYALGSSGWLAGWEKVLTKAPRPLQSVILDTDNADMILADARKFLTAGEWYSSMGIPYRRGYLLHGPPGCGKSSFSEAVAGALRLDICILNLAQEGLTDNLLAGYLRDAPHNALILLEDVDAIFVQRNASTGPSGMGRQATQVSFSGLLNALDGVGAQEGRLLIMTTNHIDRLDPALVRPGRCDVKLEIKRATKAQLSKMFTRFFPGNSTAAICFLIVD